MTDGQESRRRWIIGTAVVVVLGVTGLALTLNQTYDPANLQANADIVPVQSEHQPAVPIAPDEPTLIPLRNDGEREGRVYAARLFGGSWSPPPPPTWGAGPDIFVDFEAKHYRPETDDYYVRFPHSPIPKDETGLATVTMFDPARAGQRYTGFIEFEYDDGQWTESRVAIVDAVAERPIR